MDFLKDFVSFNTCQNQAWDCVTCSPVHLSIKRVFLMDSLAVLLNFFLFDRHAETDSCRHTVWKVGYWSTSSWTLVLWPDVVPRCAGGKKMKQSLLSELKKMCWLYLAKRVEKEHNDKENMIAMSLPVLKIIPPLPPPVSVLHLNCNEMFVTTHLLHWSVLMTLARQDCLHCSCCVSDNDRVKDTKSLQSSSADWITGRL